MLPELRDPQVIARQMDAVRANKASINTWSMEEILSDIKSLNEAILKEIEKSERRDFKNKQSLKRIRWYTKALEVLSIRFRVLSVKYGR